MVNAESKSNNLKGAEQILEKPSLKTESGESSFAFKLNPVSEKCTNFEDQNFNISPSKRVQGSNSNVS